MSVLPWLTVVGALGATAAAGPSGKALVVVLPAETDRRAGLDARAFAGTLVSEMQTSVRAAEVMSLEDAAAHSAITETDVLTCVKVSCAPKVGHGTGARWVVVTEISLVGKERVVSVRMVEMPAGRVVGMLSERVPPDDEEGMYAVAARAALRLTSAAKLDRETAKEAPTKPSPPAPPPEETPKVTPKSGQPPEEEPMKVVTVPGPRDTAQPPQETKKSKTLVAKPTAPGRNGAPAAEPKAAPKKSGSGRIVGLPARVGVGVFGVVVAAWGPLVAPVLLAGAAAALAKAVDLRTQLRMRPHDRDQIASMKQEGMLLELSSYGLIAAAGGLVVYGVVVTAVALAASLLLP